MALVTQDKVFSKCKNGTKRHPVKGTHIPFQASHLGDRYGRVGLGADYCREQDLETGTKQSYATVSETLLSAKFSP